MSAKSLPIFCFLDDASSQMLSKAALHHVLCRTRRIGDESEPMTGGAYVFPVKAIELAR